MVSSFLTSASTAGFTWRKSSFSGAQSNCVEVADDVPGIVPVRDSKNPHGAALLFTTNAWTAFVGELKRDGFPTI
ncbi:DUF397 domain-containing protein [Kitasatospora viridis]|uniref:Uncharacterized protein DUF397 n=1 Tax=Kitasatospora viridis TaxID=281105 RepID=A0A561UB04_9ACTN|nr:DUF397 domain-containing protein [Kitasatospora viridis]TWF96544.1 uncharacterized protein DUF397 [Kitasatospora viridis]